ncbi:hypothetical protein ACQP00_02080 [Dactylosporangium sp. CS-047395]|uniref:hypothetical protein n=1 Tax=Dactylosporangium sp. CS-047395 TaxID=3239936 RepID=UPI003D903E5D
MMRFDQAIHDTVDDLVADLRALPPGFAESAMTRGRRIRRTRRLATTAGALAAVLAVLLPAVLLRTPDDRREVPGVVRSSAPMTPSPSAVAPTDLVGGWRVVAAGRVALNKDGTYVRLPAAAATVLPAPAGHHALVNIEPNGPWQLMDVNGGRPVTLNTGSFIGDIRWSPTGDRAVSAFLIKDSGDFGFAIVDSSGMTSYHQVDHTRYDCSQCSFSFTRDGREVVLALADRSLGEAGDLVSALQFFDAKTAAPTRTIPAKAWTPTSPYAFSPDGRYLISAADAPMGRTVRVDLTTGATEPFPYEAVWVTDNDLLANEGLDILTLRKDGTRSSRTTLETIPDAGVPIIFGPGR